MEKYGRVRQATDDMEKYGRVRQATDDKTAQRKRMRIGCRIAKAIIKTHDRSIYYLLIFHCNNG
jgi:hypothetical protein